MEPWKLENGVPSGEIGTFPLFLIFESIEGRKLAEAARNICAVYGDNAIKESTARKWISRFKEDGLDIGDTPRSGRLSGFDEDRLNTLIHNDPLQCTRELAIPPSCDIVFNGKVKKSGVWVPHALSQNHKNQQSLLARHRLAREQHLAFLSCIVTVTRNGVFMLT